MNFEGRVMNDTYIYEMRPIFGSIWESRNCWNSALCWENAFKAPELWLQTNIPWVMWHECFCLFVRHTEPTYGVKMYYCLISWWWTIINPIEADINKLITVKQNHSFPGLKFPYWKVWFIFEWFQKQSVGSKLLFNPWQHRAWFL